LDHPLPGWEQDLIDEAIADAERRLAREKERARTRAVQLARERAYHRLAVAIDRPSPRRPGPGQLSLWADEPTLFDDASD
jgi:hypothetical protein